MKKGGKTMLTPVEIQSKTFKSGGLGYDKKDVDQFIREVLQNYEQLYRENLELSDKITALNDGIQYYKSIEKTLQKALLLAEKTAEETRITAQKEATRIITEAKSKASLITADSRNQLDRLHLTTKNMIQQYESYKIQFKNLAKTQVELLESPAFQLDYSNLEAFLENNIVAFSKEKSSSSFEDSEDSGIELEVEAPDEDLEFVFEVAASKEPEPKTLSMDTMPMASPMENPEKKEDSEKQEHFKNPEKKPSYEEKELDKEEKEEFLKKTEIEEFDFFDWNDEEE